MKKHIMIKKYVIWTAMTGMLVAPLAAEEAKPMSSQSGNMSQKSDQYAVNKSSSTKPMMKKARKKTRKM